MPACSGRLKGVPALVSTVALLSWAAGGEGCRPRWQHLIVRRCALMAQMGLQGVATDQGGAASWPYASAGGELVITPPDMPAVSEAGGSCCR